MKRLAALLSCLLHLASINVQAQVTAPPALINFQGRLATPSGNPVPDGTYSVRFSLWNVASGGTVAANEKWHKIIENVAVRNGTFAVTLDTFPAGTFNGNLWLEIKIGADTTLTPRTSLVSVPYAMKSDLALTVPDGSLTASKFASGLFNSTAWLLSGNSGVTGGFLGTTDNQPLVFRTSNTERMRILSNGNVGIGTTAPKGKLHVNGTYYGLGDVRLHAFEGDGSTGTAYIQACDDSTTSSIGMVLRTKRGAISKDNIVLRSDGTMGVNGLGYGGVTLSVVDSGLEYAIGTFGKIGGSQFVTLSDARLKQNIETVPDALSTLLNLRGVSYDWNPNVPNAIKGQNDRQYGFLAQEVEQVLPALVHPGLNGYKAVNYQGIIPVTVEAIKTQQSQIVALKEENNAKAKRLATVEADNAAIKAKNGELEAMLKQLAERVNALEAGQRK